jgi:DNA-binding NtrC family response regulator
MEDDRVILNVLRKILISEGYEVEAVTNGEEGIRKCRVKPFDLALLDIRLPRMNGTKVLEVLHREFPNMIKIMITGYPSLENAAISLKRGADAYLMKPVNPSSLLKVIKEKISERSKSR